MFTLTLKYDNDRGASLLIGKKEIASVTYDEAGSAGIKLLQQVAEGLRRAGYCQVKEVW